MARHKSPLQINLEYAFVQGLFGLLRTLPLGWGITLCRGLLKVILGVQPRRRRILAENIATCFPEKTPAQRQAIAEESIDTVAKGVAYFPRLSDLFKEDVSSWLRMEGFEYPKEALKQGKGVILFTAHYGCWEAMPLCFNRFLAQTSAVARPLDNPKLDELVTSVRSATGAKVVVQHQVIKQGLRNLRNNEILGFLIDQNFYKGGIFIDFFGRPASSTTIVSVLARRTGAAVIPVHTLWKGDKLHIIMEPQITLSENPDPEMAAAEDTQKMAKIMEGWIQKVPGQWLWLHNRWKRKPALGDYVYTVKT